MVNQATAFQKSGAKSLGQKVLVGMSGNLLRGDSLLVAALLKSQGYTVLAYHLRYTQQGSITHLPKMDCLNEVPQEAVKKLCDHLEIPLIVENGFEEFSEKVLDQMLHEGIASRQARPCVWCHQSVRIPRLFKKADELGIEKVATGHHAQISNDLGNQKYRLKSSVNRNLDQTSDLFQLNQQQLMRMILPLGAIAQPMLARLSAELNLGKVTGPKSTPANVDPYANQPECMTADSQFFDFIEKRTSPTLRMPGVIRGLDGTVLAEHNGTYRFRIGDILPGMTLVSGQAYVIGIDYALNAVLAGPIAALKTSEVLVKDVKWVVPINGLKAQSCLAYSPSPQGKLVNLPQAAEFVMFENATARVYLKTPSADFLPGRPILFYDGEEVLGGGFVDRIHGVSS